MPDTEQPPSGDTAKDNPTSSDGGMTDAPPPLKRKSMAATTLLAALLGFGGVCGIGHIYVGRVRRGIIILVPTLVAAALWGAVFVVALPDAPDPTATMADQAASMWVVVGFVAWMVYVGLAMVANLGIQGMWALVVLVMVVMVPVGFVTWTIFDARKLCKAYNAVMDETGRPPW